MNQNKLYPFERNRYYAGKMLTSADFQAEQDYINNKERFMNTLMYGSGVVCGLNVFSLDDVSVLVESGVAIDAFGRQIVLENSIVRKLTAIEGYEDLTTEEAYLCIQYDEKPVHVVYALEQSGRAGNHEYGRVAENYSIFLKDTEAVMEDIKLPSEFLTGDVIYKDQDYQVELLIPGIVSRGKDVKMLIRTTKLSDAANKLILHAVVQIPGLSYGNSQEIEIDLEDLILEKGETFDKSYWITAHKNELNETNLLLKSGSAYAYIDDEAVKVSTDFRVKILFSDALPRDLVNRAAALQNLELRESREKAECIYLAKIKFIRSATSLVIDSVDEWGIKKYVTAPSSDAERAEYLEYFVPEPSQVKTGSKPIASAYAALRETSAANVPEMSTGTLEIPLGSSPKKGGVFYSGEIVHGLGKGDVYVQIGFEAISSDEALGLNAKSTIYGDARLFSGASQKLPNAETAIKVNNDKGSFVVAAKLDDNVSLISLTYRWVAIKFPGASEAVSVDDYAGKSIVPETPTVILDANESHFFGVKFQNMESCSLTYTLTEENSGEITTDGVYTAPSKEGVYEICIFCTDMPLISAYAYAIVKKKNAISDSDALKGLGVTASVPKGVGEL